MENDVAMELSEMVKVLRGLAITLELLNEHVGSVNFTLADIRDLLLNPRYN